MTTPHPKVAVHTAQQYCLQALAHIHPQVQDTTWALPVQSTLTPRCVTEPAPARHNGLSADAVAPGGRVT